MNRVIRCLAGLAVVVAISASCTRTQAEALEATSQQLLGYLPQGAHGVFFVDVAKAMSLPIARDAMEKKNNKDYEEFLEDTGIDLRKDVHGMAFAVTGDMNMNEGDGVMVARVDYDRGRFMDAAKSKGDVTETEYKGIMIFETEEGKDTGLIALLDDKHLAMGTTKAVHGVIDVLKGQSKSALNNAGLIKLLDDVDNSSILWMVMVPPREALEGMANGNPMMGNLTDLESVVANVNYATKEILCTIITRSDNPEKNEQMADFLKGIKAFGAMAASENPEAAAVLQGLEITGSADHVKIMAVIPESVFADAMDDVGH